MRWTNHFIHPGDNRYHVFAFREQGHAEEFEGRLGGEGISFERHQEDGEWLFAVKRSEFREALRQNHLVHAAHRDPFIPLRGWRWALLVFTGLVVGLAVLGWLTSSTAQAQELPWELDVLARVQVPVEAMGVTSVSMAEGGLSSTWHPQVGSDFGLRINRRLKEGWSVASGLEWIRRDHLVITAMQVDSLNVSTVDTLPKLTSISYRLPVLAGYRLPVGVNDWEVIAGVGLGLEWRTSETMVGGAIQDGAMSRQVQAYSGRSRFWSFPLMAEFGFQKPADGDELGWYVGWHWSSPLGRTTWAESTWQLNSLGAGSRNWLHHTVAALEVRLILPE